MVLKEAEMKQISHLDLFCDVGPHFYNKFVLHHIFNTSLFEKRSISLTFFCEHHGKSHCDAAFGTLTKAICQCIPLSNVQTCSDLISFFNSLKEDQSECFKKIKEEHIFREYDYTLQSIIMFY
jgi:hypothetical protein